MSTLRLHDWLAVLGFVRDDHVQYLNYRATFALRLDHPRWQKVSDWLNRTQAPMGGVYITLATRETYANLRDPRQRVRSKPNIAPLTVPKPTARQ